MSGKVDIHTDKELKHKNKRKIISLLQKVDMLDKIDRGMATAAVGCHCLVSEWKTCFVRKWRQYRRALHFNPSSVKISCVSPGDPFLKNMGRALCVTPKGETQIGLSVSGDVVREKPCQHL